MNGSQLRLQCRLVWSLISLSLFHFLLQQCTLSPHSWLRVYFGEKKKGLGQRPAFSAALAHARKRGLFLPLSFPPFSTLHTIAQKL